MSEAVVVGGSVAGLASAFALAEAGFGVRVVERDGEEPPAGVDAEWVRPTVPQASHSHAFASFGCGLLADRAPGVYAELVAAGARPISLTDALPPSLAGFVPEPEDEKLRMLGCRRSVFERVLRREVRRHPGVAWEAPATVRGLEFAAGDHRQVSGVRLADGRVLGAVVVVDATGRRSKVARWLADAGRPAPAPASAPADIVYYTRFYRLLADRPPGPLNRGFGAGGLWDHYTAVLFTGDNGTFSISVGVLPEDTPMKALRAEAAFTAALRATPLLAPWLEPGVSEPISPVHAMGGLDNSLRPPPPSAAVTGLFSVGDAACTTNPAYGRGVSLALGHAFGLADLLAAGGGGAAQATAFADLTTTLLAPWHAEAAANDAGRALLWRATVAGTAPPAPPPGVVTFGAAVAAAATDPVVWRRVARVMMMLSPPASLYADDAIRARIGAALAAGPPPAPPGATRADLVRVVTTAAARAA